MVHLFVYDGYYPQGGMSDYRGSFPDVTAAVNEITENWKGYDFYDIARADDTGRLVIVRSGRIGRDGSVE